MKWQKTKFWLWLEIGFPVVEGLAIYGKRLKEIPGAQGAQGPQDACADTTEVTTVCFDLLSFQSDFELNSIPKALVSVALGRRADDLTHASAIHSYIDKLQLQLPASVYCQAKTLDTSEEGEPTDMWPVSFFRVFEGLVTGSAFRRHESGVDFSLSLTHWLSNLNFSSALSKQSHPLNPSQWFFPAQQSLDLTGSGGTFLFGNGETLVPAGLASPFFTEEVILTDLWGGLGTFNEFDQKYLTGIKDWLLTLTRQNRINAVQIQQATGINIEASINIEACRALYRFEPDAKGEDFSETGYTLGVPLALPDNADLNTYISAAIVDEMGSETFYSNQNTTLWDKLASQYHTNYMFSIVPLVEKALIVPFVPGLSSGNDDTLVHRVLYASEYDSIEIHNNIIRPLRAVGLIMGYGMQAGGGVTKDPAAPYGTFGGYFDKWMDACTADGGAPADCDQKYKYGLIMFKHAPKWMIGVVPHRIYSPKSTAVTGIDIQTTLTPLAGVEADFADPRTIFINARPVWDLYARTLYIHEVLKNRQGTLTGPVRFDIAPGSQIIVQVTEDKYISQILDPNSCDLVNMTFNWCSVLRVSTVIDCQNMRAYTNFFLGHIRSEEENKDAGTSIDRHPLWQANQWAGCVMIEKPEFGTQVTKTPP